MMFRPEFRSIYAHKSKMLAKRLEKLCRYIARTAVSEKRLSLLDDGRIRYVLKTPYREGTTQVMLLRASCPPPNRTSLLLSKIAPGDFVEPLDFLARLTALVPKPWVNLTRFHGLFAPNSKHRVNITPAKRGKGRARAAGEDDQSTTPAKRRAALTSAQRLKRVFNIDIEIYPKCGGALRIIACIEDPVVIHKILAHLDNKAALAEALVWARSWAPPQGICLTDLPSNPSTIQETAAIAVAASPQFDCDPEIRVLPWKSRYRKWNSPKLQGSNGVSLRHRAPFRCL